MRAYIRCESSRIFIHSYAFGWRLSLIYTHTHTHRCCRISLRIRHQLSARALHELITHAKRECRIYSSDLDLTAPRATVVMSVRVRTSFGRVDIFIESKMGGQRSQLAHTHTHTSYYITSLWGTITHVHGFPLGVGAMHMMRFLRSLSYAYAATRVRINITFHTPHDQKKAHTRRAL